MPNNPINGQDLIDLTNARLAGYANAVSQDDLLGFLCQAKDQVWGILKEQDEEYFLTFSQATTSTNPYYFAPLNTTTREYDLPDDFQEIKFIEVLTQGFADLKFVYRDATQEDFRSARRGANANNTPLSNPDTMLYTIIGKGKFVLADYPPATLNLQLWYTRLIPDFEAADTIDEILFPFSKLLADFAAKRIMLATQDPTQFAAWSEAWREDVIAIAQGSGPRNQSDPTFVSGLMEDGDC